jgi:ribosomal protein L11 methylase PrmA
MRILMCDRTTIYMLFWKEQSREQKCLKCGKLRYVKVVNKDGEKMVTKVIAQKQLWYMPLTPRMKCLFLSRKTTMHMRWHKDRTDKKDGLMVHPLDGDAPLIQSSLGTHCTNKICLILIYDATKDKEADSEGAFRASDKPCFITIL